MLEVEEVHCSYGPILALEGVSLSAATGAVVCVLGANGAGKSTLLKTIAGIIRPRHGAVRLEGELITRLDPAKRVSRGIALCPEGRRIFPDFTVEENLAIGGHLLPRQVLRGRIAEAADRFPILKDRMRQPGGLLSGGQQQMLAIARALMTEPKLLLLDEPSLGLAPILIGEVFETVETIRRQGTTVVIVEQNRRILDVADYAYVLANGRVDFEGPAHDVRADARLQNAYLGDGGARSS